jgi:ribosomal protein S18 acetylase RimI-like enzyme
MTDRFVLSTAQPSQLARLGEIQAAAFAQADSVLAALPDVSRADHAAWAEQRLRHFRTPPGHRTEIVCATKNGSDQIVGFAQWIIPLDDAADAPPAPVPPPVPFPAKAKAEVWAEYGEGAIRCEKEVMGEAEHWSAFYLLLRTRMALTSSDLAALILLGTDPAFSRQGIGRALAQWGVARAAASNLPIFILSNTQGVKLYSSLGFSKGEPQKLGSARIPVTPMFKGLVAPASAL